MEYLLANERLVEAARAGDIGGIRAALADGATEGSLALDWAICRDMIDAVAYLLDRGFRPGHTGKILANSHTRALLKERLLKPGHEMEVYGLVDFGADSADHRDGGN